MASRREDFPVPQIAALARARFRDDFAKLCPSADLPRHVWQIPWVVHITPWGEGQQVAVDYLARYAFRIAITNILAVDNQTVTYRYKDRAADRHRNETVSGHEFIRRFLQHVLPAGFHKVRYYGLLHASRREQLRNLQNVLLLCLVIGEQAVRPLGTIWHTQPEKERILTNPGEALSNWRGSKLDKYLMISMSKCWS